MALKLFLSHILISLITIPALALAKYDTACMFLLLTSGTAYVLTGYVATKRYTAWYNYVIVALVGVSLWIICYLTCPESTDYKSEANAGIWFYYELYITVRSPLNFLTDENPYNLTTDLLSKLSIPVLASILQFTGGQLKRHFQQNQ